jgi:hypothetical protein
VPTVVAVSILAESPHDEDSDHVDDDGDDDEARLLGMRLADFGDDLGA